MFGSLPSFWNDIGNAVWIGIIGFLSAFIVYLLSARLTKKKTWLRFIGNLLALVIVIWTIKLLLDSTGAAGVMVILGTALTGAFALGSETIASDFVSGIKLFASRPFTSGHLVTIAGQTGVVKDVGLTNTTLVSYGNKLTIIRNSDVVTGSIINHSTQPMQFIEIQVTLPVSQDLQKAVSVILKEIKESSPEITDDRYMPGIICGSIVRDRWVMIVYNYVKLMDLTCLDDEKTKLMLTTIRALVQNEFVLGK